MSWWRSQRGSDGRRYVIASEIWHVLFWGWPIILSLLVLLLLLLGWLPR